MSCISDHERHPESSRELENFLIQLHADLCTNAAHCSTVAASSEFVADLKAEASCSRAATAAAASEQRFLRFQSLYNPPRPRAASVGV